MRDNGMMKFATVINDEDEKIYVNPDAVACVYGDSYNFEKATIELNNGKKIKTNYDVALAIVTLRSAH